MRNLLPLQLQTTTIAGIGNYHHQIPIESGTPCTIAEAECDIDTLKKLKLGMRSSLWSRPPPNVIANENGQTLSSNSQLRQHIEPGSNPSDYSIAV